MNAIDTNVLIYALDSDEPIKQAKAKTLLNCLVGTSSPTLLPWQVAGELLNWLRKWEMAGRISSADVESHFRDMLTLFPIAIPAVQAFKNYFDLRKRFKLSHWDTMLLGACKEARVTTLYSEDMGAGIDYDGIIVINPFA